MSRLEEMNGITAEMKYPILVEQKIRRRYSVSAELAILRQRDEKPSEYSEYFAYCEACKAEAREELGIQ